MTFLCFTFSVSKCSVCILLISCARNSIIVVLIPCALCTQVNHKGSLPSKVMQTKVRKTKKITFVSSLKS